ncbi:unnamed protein product (mitochondrion) [Plasmodiophora brassicae]|uniref:Uncharacterized protein n=1 Tax=Plasmodiophora brassicae TaxID=37360 RepID=A0A3P3YFZ8_PLABS|nr:unnamed protein product [Plasmodiophora brassicae]
MDPCDIDDPCDIGALEDSAHRSTTETMQLPSDDGETGHSDGNDTPWVPAPAMTFDIHVEVKHFLEAYAKKTGFHINVQFKTFAKKERSIELFGNDGAWVREQDVSTTRIDRLRSVRAVDVYCT